MNIKLLSDKAIVPTRGTEDSAGYDLYAAEAVTIMPQRMVKVPTNIALEIPVGYFGGVYARSGMATKRGLRPANCVAVIDADYRGDITVPLYNDSNEIQTIEAGTRIAQLIIQPFIAPELNVVTELNETSRGASGFGSTGE